MLGMMRFKFNFNDLIFQCKYNFIFRVERKSMDLLLKIANSFNEVVFNRVIMGPPKIAHSSKNKQRSCKGSISLEFQW